MNPKPKRARLDLTAEEYELFVLASANDLLGRVLSRFLYEVVGSAPEQIVYFHDDLHQRHFYLLILDFIQPIDWRFVPAAGKTESMLDLLRGASGPLPFLLQEEYQPVREAANLIVQWLGEPVPREVWAPDLDRHIRFTVTRGQMIRIAGNANKHAYARLGGVAEELLKALLSPGEVATLEDAMIALEVVYEDLHNNILNYHGSEVVSMLVNLRRAIFFYLKLGRQVRTEFEWQSLIASIPHRHPRLVRLWLTSLVNGYGNGSVPEPIELSWALTNRY